MRHTRHFRRPFDPRCEFIYLKALKVGGVSVQVGDPVAKSAVGARRLRQFYEGRLADYAPGSSPAKPAPRPLAVGPTDMIHYDEARAPEKPRKRGIARVLRAA